MERKERERATVNNLVHLEHMDSIPFINLTHLSKSDNLLSEILVRNA